MPPELVFGKRTAILLIFALQGLVVAAALSNTRHNRRANRFLAALLCALSLALGPDIIGFAGFYDRWQWLTFAPFRIDTLIGPLFFLYIAALTQRELPATWRRHLWLPAAELAYRCVCFALPFDAKMRWAIGVHEPYVAPVLSWAGIVSLGAYLVLSAREHRRYQAWLADHVSFSSDFTLPWIRAFLLALGTLLALALGFTVYDALVADLGYWGWYYFYVALAVITYALGVVGWRMAEREYPLPSNEASAAEPQDAATDVPAAVVPAGDEPRGPDWTALATRWREQVQREQLWRDPQLTLPRLAGRLGVSQAQLSRAINQGLGLNFNQFINRMRVDSVRQSLADPLDKRSVLRIALDAGFSSKASFNRAFKAETGRTPSDLRRGEASASDA